MSLSPAEDLFREHAVIRRLLLLYSFFVTRIARGEPIEFSHVRATARLFEKYGGYHAASEERFIFPLFRGTSTAPIVRGFVKDHRIVDRLTKTILANSVRRQSIGSAQRQVNALYDAMSQVVSLYRAHATHEDLIVNARLHEVITDAQAKELAERSEAFEHKKLGQHGFRDAMTALGEIERPLKLNSRALYSTG